MLKKKTPVYHGLLLLWWTLATTNAQNVANTCAYHCPNTDESPWNKKGHIFSSNGCGSGGIQVKLDARIAPCCDTHDACYSVCGISRDYCDTQFNKCIVSGCGEDEKCKQSASMITFGASLFGCEPFLQSQQESCDCLKGHELDVRVMNTLQEMYSKLSEENSKTLEQLQVIQDKYKGKESKLINNILKKYPKSLIQMQQMENDFNFDSKGRKKKRKRHKPKSDL